MVCPACVSEFCYWNIHAIELDHISNSRLRNCNHRVGNCALLKGHSRTCMKFWFLNKKDGVVFFSLVNICDDHSFFCHRHSRTRVLQLGVDHWGRSLPINVRGWGWFRPGAKFGLSFLLVLVLLWGFSPGSPVFLPPQKPTFLHSSSTKNRGLAWKPAKPGWLM